MEVTRTSMIHVAAPRYAAHQLNLWPRVSFAETSHTLRWSRKVGDATVFRGPAPSGVSQVDPLPGTVPVEVAVGLGAAPGAASGGVESGGAELGVAESEGAGSGGAEPGVEEPGVGCRFSMDYEAGIFCHRNAGVTEFIVSIDTVLACTAAEEVVWQPWVSDFYVFRAVTLCGCREGEPEPEADHTGKVLRAYTAGRFYWNSG
ncbi:unnamed protein product [Closterium sp. NIES-54]